MNTTLSLEYAFKTIAVGYRKESNREAVRDVLIGVTIFFILSLCLIVFGVLMAGEAHKELEMPWHLAIRPPGLLCGGLILAIGTVVFLVLRDRIENLKTTERLKLQYLKDHPKGSFFAYKLFEYAFYELAQDAFDQRLAYMFEESRKSDEKLLCFLEEYRTQPRFVGGFPRPMPRFASHNLDEFMSCITWRAKCLIKLGREEEAEATLAQCGIIKKIEYEVIELREKYWGNEYID